MINRKEHSREKRNDFIGRKYFDGEKKKKTKGLNIDEKVKALICDEE